jgi:predicted Zn finger-like uncharacterized protein
MFRVVPDQLRISEGWVRCGQCDEVFDANAHLQSLEVQPQKVAEEVQASENSFVEPRPTPLIAVQTAADVAYDWGPMLAPEKSQEPSSDELLAEEAQPGPTDYLQSDGLLDQSPHDLPASEESQGAHYAPASDGDWVYQSPLAHDLMDSPEGVDAEEDAAPSFMPRSPRRTWADRYLGYRVMLPLFFVLGLLLASQFLFLERDRIAANVPALRPLLDSGCSVLGCTLSMPRQIESIAIDSSAFTRVKSGVYSLSLSLRNAAAIDLAAPAIELTLTDMQDQALVRRVLLPGEYSAKTLIGAGGELVVNVPIAVRAGTASENISGYKLLAFYP